MIRLSMLLSVLLACTLARADTASPINAVDSCLFDAANGLCETQDWNDDAVVTAADLPGRLRFTSPLGNAIRVVDTGAALIARSAAAKVRIDKTTLGLALDNSDGVRLTESASPPTVTLGDTTQPLTAVRSVRPLASGFELTCAAGTDTVLWTIEFLTPRSLRATLHPQTPGAVTRVQTSVHAMPGERFYGLTERIADAASVSVTDRRSSEVAPKAVGSLDRRGQSITMVVIPTLSLYTPFFHSSRGYGVFVEGTMTGRYDLAKTDPDTVAIDFEFNQRTAEHSVVYFVGGYETILDEYTGLTGRPFVPPRWGFKHLRWRDEHRLADPAVLDGVQMNADFVNDISMYDTLGLPIGNYEFDRPWSSGTTDRGEQGFASFSFDPVRFPNSDKMIKALHDRGYHVLIFGAPWALGDNAVEAEQKHYYAPRSRILIDYTNPEAAAWWSGKVQSLIDLGIAGMKLDRSEFALSEIGLTDVVPDQATDVFADGRNGRELINGYTLEYARVHFQAFEDRVGGDYFHYLRAGYAGSQRYGIFWGGDTTGRESFGIGKATDLGLRSAIQSLAHVAFMGFSIWGTDTGGYYQFGDRDLFARWLEFSAFCPLMEIGGGNQGGGQHAPWDMPTEPHFDSGMIDIYRTYTTLHHELVPLIYSLALESGDSGRPLARPLVFDYPDDPAVGDMWDELLLGHDLLFAPVWHVGDRGRSVYLPRGTWIDYWQPINQFVGPTTITVNAPLERIPLYVRGGAIIPLDVNSDVTGNGSQALSAGRLTLDVYPQADSTFVLREGNGAQSTFTLSHPTGPGAPCIELDLSPSQRGYVIRMLTGAPIIVTLNDVDLPGVDSLTALAAVDTGCFYDFDAGRLWCKFATNGAAARLGVICAAS